MTETKIAGAKIDKCSKYYLGYLNLSGFNYHVINA